MSILQPFADFVIYFVLWLWATIKCLAIVFVIAGPIFLVWHMRETSRESERNRGRDYR